MNREVAEEYTEGLAGVFVGGWRLIQTAQKLGVPKALGLTTEDWVRERLGGYTRLAIEERREAVAELTEEGLSTREQAAVLGVGNKTVNRDQAAVSNDTPEVPVHPASAEAAVSNDTPEPPGAPEPQGDAEADVEHGTPLDPMGCAIERAACARNPRLKKAVISKSRAHLVFERPSGGLVAYRYEISGAIRNAIMAFDFSEGKAMLAQGYTLKAMRPSETVPGKRAKSKALPSRKTGTHPQKGKRSSLHWARGFDPQDLTAFQQAA